MHAFGGEGDGFSPNGIIELNGSFYGTTQSGGAHKFGTVFKLSAAGEETVLHSFGKGTDGATPDANLVADIAANLYGTTYAGGTHGVGTVFSIAPDGSEKVLYSFFGDGADGVNPISPLIVDGAGNLYGTTAGHIDCGTVFKLGADGSQTVLHHFKFSEGCTPYGGLLRDRKGRLYGTTTAGGSGGAGVIFQLTE